MATKQEPVRRTDVIRCEKCGEDYSVTYKRCPFCDERPTRTRRVNGDSGGRRVAGGRRRRGGVNPLQVIGVVGSLALIIAALYIVFTVISPLLGLGDPSSSQSNSPSPGTSVTPPASSSTQTDPSGSTVDPGTSGTDTPVEPDPGPEVVTPVAPTVNSISLNKSDITMGKNEKVTLKVTVDPTDAAVIWTSSDESVAKVAQDGTVYNVNTASGLKNATITATAGDKTATCIVRCKGGSSALNFPSDYAPGTVPADTPSTGTTTPSTGTDTPSTGTTTPSTGTDTPSTGTTSTGTAMNATGVVTGAGSGLNARSGPGSSYQSIATLGNGAEVKILEDTGTGWYKISFSGIGGKKTEGYASKNYIVIR